MLTLQAARAFAQEWEQAWNSHDLERILLHYAPAVTLTSPVAARLLNNPDVVGKEALRQYFQTGIQAYPNLAFRVVDVTCGVSSIVIYYENQNGVRVSEFMEFDSDGQVTRVIAHYNT